MKNFNITKSRLRTCLGRSGPTPTRGKPDVHSGLPGRDGVNLGTAVRGSPKESSVDGVEPLDTLLDQKVDREVRMLLSFQRPSHLLEKGHPSHGRSRDLRTGSPGRTGKYSAYRRHFPARATSGRCWPACPLSAVAVAVDSPAPRAAAWSLACLRLDAPCGCLHLQLDAARTGCAGASFRFAFSRAGLSRVAECEASTAAGDGDRLPSPSDAAPAGVGGDRSAGAPGISVHKVAK